MKAKVSVDDMAEEGAHIGPERRDNFGTGRETRETIWWLVVNPAVSEFEAYSELNRIARLP